MDNLRKTLTRLAATAACAVALAPAAGFAADSDWPSGGTPGADWPSAAATGADWPSASSPEDSDWEWG